MSQENKGYEIKEKEVIIGDAILMFDYPIKESVEFKEILIVRLEKPFKTIYNENVFGINLIEGKIQWRIAKIQYHLTDCPFIGIETIENKIKLYNWCDIYVIIDPISGSILEQSLPMKY